MSFGTLLIDVATTIERGGSCIMTDVPCRLHSLLPVLTPNASAADTPTTHRAFFGYPIAIQEGDKATIDGIGYRINSVSLDVAGMSHHVEANLMSWETDTIVIGDVTYSASVTLKSDTLEQDAVRRWRLRIAEAVVDSAAEFTPGTVVTYNGLTWMITVVKRARPGIQIIEFQNMDTREMGGTERYSKP